MINKYPYTDFNEYNMDWIIKTVKDLTVEWAETKTEWSDVKTEWENYKLYIENYFANLDVSAEINAKLEDMAASGELTQVVAPLFAEAIADVPAIVTEWINNNLVQETGYVLDDSLTVDLAAANALAAGTHVLNIEKNVSMDIVTCDAVEAGYYSSVDGSKQSGGSYYRSIKLIPVEPLSTYINILDTNEVRAACFDESGAFLYTCRFYDKTNIGHTWFVTPAGCKYVGLYANNATGFGLKRMPEADTFEVKNASAEDSFVYFPGKWMDGNGAIQTAATLGLMIIPNIKPGEKYFVSTISGNGMLFFSQQEIKLTATSELVGAAGRVWTAPADAVIAYVNMTTNHVASGTDSTHVDYAAHITKEKVLAVGDSLTWLDGQGVFDGTNYLAGWQKQLRLAGYDVRTAAWSGYPYAEGLDISGGNSYSIYEEIVTNSYSVSGYDKVILFGGTNDVLYDGALGTRDNVYSNRTFDSYTFNGALGGIIDYIRQNGDAEIYLASFPKSEASSRIYTNAVQRVDEIEYNAGFWSCGYINVFRDMNVQPTYSQFADFFYDPTHPTFKGMERIGSVMLKAIE